MNNVTTLSKETTEETKQRLFEKAEKLEDIEFLALLAALWPNEFYKKYGRILFSGEFEFIVQPPHRK